MERRPRTMKQHTDATGQVFNTRLGEMVIECLLGKGKSGYSYLATYGDQAYVLKRIHYEPCPYYAFGDANKVMLEVNAYHLLVEMGITVPRLYDHDPERNYLLKQFIPGETAIHMIITDSVSDAILKQLFLMFYRVRAHNKNIDYFPTNFVVNDMKLYYIDYEVNTYSAQWDLVNWGLYYWANSQGLRKFMETHDVKHINISPDSGIPHKAPYAQRVASWVEKFAFLSREKQ